MDTIDIHIHPNGQKSSIEINGVEQKGCTSIAIELDLKGCTLTLKGHDCDEDGNVIIHKEKLVPLTHTLKIDRSQLIADIKLSRIDSGT